MASKFKRELNTLDVLVVAFGAMIGWGWVVASGSWIQSGGVLGTILGFVIGGLMIYFVGLVYSELTTTFPKAGGEMVFSYKAFGPIGSFVCTWMLILSYVGVVCFESCSFPVILQYIFPGLLRGYMYTVAGFKVYASWVAIAVVTAAFIMVLNLIGTKKAAIFQTFFTCVIAAVGILLLAGASFTGSISNVANQAFVGTAWGKFENVLKVAIMTPFFFFGFDVIPQTSEEISVPLKKLGRMMILSIIMAVGFYSMVVFAVGLVFDSGMMADSMAKSGLVTADAMAKAFSSPMMAKVLIIGGLCGIITSWNSFLIGGSRCVYAMSAAHMLPGRFSRLHDRYHTPTLAILLMGGLSIAAPFFGRVMLLWIVDAANFACCLAYCIVALSFLAIRKKYPTVVRPFKVRAFRFVGIMASLMSGVMATLYLLPGTSCSLIWQEWIIVGGWASLGCIFFVVSKCRYGRRFASEL